MRELRRALGDDARRPRFVEAVPGAGYRFLGGVELRLAEPGGPEPTGPPSSIVVPPFAGPSGTLGAVAALAAAEVATALARHAHLRLVPHPGGLRLDGDPFAAQAAARQAGARHVVIGALHPAGRGGRLHVPPLDVGADLTLWADAIALRRPLDGAARGAARKIAGEIASRLGEPPEPRSGTRAIRPDRVGRDGARPSVMQTSG